MVSSEEKESSLKMEVDKNNVVVKIEIEDKMEEMIEATSRMNDGSVTIKTELIVPDLEPIQDMEVDKVEKTDTLLEEKVVPEEPPLQISIISKDEGLVCLSIENDEDDDSETVIMTPEEVRVYLYEKINNYIKDPNFNPLLKLDQQCLDLQQEIKCKNEEFLKLNKLSDLIQRNQEKFLRQVGVLPKVPTNSVSVAVDLPMLPNSVPPISKFTSNAPVSTPSTPSSSKTKELPTKDKTKSPGDDVECIDLTDEMDPPTAASASCVATIKALTMVKHPAPLPPRPFCVPNKALPNLPPKPRLKISAEDRGIVLQWDMAPNLPPNHGYGKLSSFDIFGYQEQKNIPINTLLWKKIGNVKAMNLPMACTLTQFVEGNKYHFAIRAVDVHNRFGSYSDPISIVYNQTKR